MVGQRFYPTISILSGTISRVMSRVIIYLGLLLPTASSDLPESRSGKPVAFCLVLLRMGFTYAPSVTRRAVVSYTAFPPLPIILTKQYYRRFISVALALESPPPDVIRHPALRSPDFPHLSYDSRDHLSHLALSCFMMIQGCEGYESVGIIIKGF